MIKLNIYYRNPISVILILVKLKIYDMKDVHATSENYKRLFSFFLNFSFLQFLADAKRAALYIGWPQAWDGTGQNEMGQNTKLSITHSFPLHGSSYGQSEQILTKF